MQGDQGSCPARTDASARSHDTREHGQFCVAFMLALVTIFGTILARWDP